MKPSKICPTCNKLFFKTTESGSYWERRKFCSIGCSGTLIKKGVPLPSHIKEKMKGRTSHFKGKKRPEITGSSHPNFKAKIQKVCLYCSAQFSVQQYRAEAKFCSRKCRYKFYDRGISSENEKQRRGKAYKEWRKAVFERDNFTCQECGQRGGILNSDHIMPFSLFKSLRFDISNGRTLCRACHLKTPTFGRRALSAIKKQKVMSEGIW